MQYDGHHIAIYVGEGLEGFKAVFDKLKARDLVWVNPRFSDKAEDWEGAVGEMQFRFKDFAGGKGEERFWECEHEVRCSGHKDNRSDLD